MSIFDDHRRLQSDYERVKEERDELRRALSLDMDQRQLDKIRETLHIKKSLAVALACLYLARNRWVNRYGLTDFRQVHGLMADGDNVCSVSVCELRRQLGRDIVENMHGPKWKITQKGIELVEEALRQ